LRELLPAKDVAAMIGQIDAAASEAAVAVFRTTQRSKNGMATPAEWHVSRVCESGAQYWIVVTRPLPVADDADASRQSQVESFGLGLPGHDPLTGLPDRRLFDRRLARAMECARQQSDCRFAVCFIDLDGFKCVNDSFGHLVGDRVLCEVARRLVGCIRPNDMAARYGGDEFTIFLDNVRNDADAGRVAERVLDRLQAPATIDDREVVVRASVGVALSSADCRQIQELLHRADRAMYRAKSLGGGQWVVFDGN
jgi:diguanylate cyclase (GGDEF)-like protein